MEGAIRGLELRAPGRSPAGRRLLEGAMPARPTALLTGCRSTGSMAATAMSGWRDTGSTRPSPRSMVLEPAHGVARDLGDASRHAARGEGRKPWQPAHRHMGWDAALALTGALHLEHPAMRAAFDSPFDYAAQTRMLVVNDLERERPAGHRRGDGRTDGRPAGGGLGLFTAIRRLRNVYPDLARLEAEGLPLYAQHVDRMNLQTLPQIFREEPAFLPSGTDDGARRHRRSRRGAAPDHLRPDALAAGDILFKARAEWQGRDAWTERTRLKLRQAFGRLIRSPADRGRLRDARQPAADTAHQRLPARRRRSNVSALPRRSA